jgi:hypothetical protein
MGNAAMNIAECSKIIRNASINNEEYSNKIIQTCSINNGICNKYCGMQQ